MWRRIIQRMARNGETQPALSNKEVLRIEQRIFDQEKEIDDSEPEFARKIQRLKTEIESTIILREEKRNGKDHKTTAGPTDTLAAQQP